MLYLIFLLLLLLPTATGLGAIVKWGFKSKITGLAFQALLGLGATSVVWTALAFFVPLGLLVEVITLLCGITAFFYFQLYQDFWIFLKKNPLLFSSLTGIVILLGSFYPFILDHFGYYVPTINWLSQIGLVQGISNLDLLVAQNSFWHILQAGFSHFADPFLRLNVVLMMIYVIYIIEKKTWIHLAFFPLFCLFLQSPSPDLPAVVVSLIILNEVFRANKNGSLLLALSVWVFAVKPTLIWVPFFLTCYNFFVLKVTFKKFLPAGIILLLFLFKNIWTFGFPVFPVEFFDLGLSWKPNSRLLKNSGEIAILKTYDMRYTYEQIQQFTSLDYLVKWLFLPGIKGVINIGLMLALVIFFIFSVLKKSKLMSMLFAAVFVKCVLVLLFSAQYRFFFDVFFVVFFVLFSDKFNKTVPLSFLSLGTILVLTAMSFPHLLITWIPSFKLGNYMTGFTKTQFCTPATFSLNKFNTHQIGNLKFNVVADGYIFSFDTPLPAMTPQYLQEDLDAGIFPQLKGESLHDGFIWRVLTPQEKDQLRHILQDLSRRNP